MASGYSGIKPLNKKNNGIWSSYTLICKLGHGGLYGTDEKKYRDFVWNSGRYIDVPKLINTYRQKVNPDVLVFLVQIAGYQDTIIPEFYDKTYILGGWGDGILRFAAEMAGLTAQE